MSTRLGFNSWYIGYDSVTWFMGRHRPTWQALMLETSCAFPWLLSVPSLSKIIPGWFMYDIVNILRLIYWSCYLHQALAQHNTEQQVWERLAFTSRRRVMLKPQHIDVETTARCGWVPSHVSEISYQDFPISERIQIWQTAPNLPSPLPTYLLLWYKVTR